MPFKTKFKVFIQTLKYAKWDYSDPYGRIMFAEWFFRNIPGRAGIYIRNQVVASKFKSAGKELKILTGNHFRGAYNLVIGNNTMLGPNNFIDAQGGLTIGDYCMIGPNVSIWTQNHSFILTNTPIIQQPMVEKPVYIGNDVWIGGSCFIMPGTILGDGVIVSAGSVVGAKEVPGNTILAGNPARKIGTR